MTNATTRRRERPGLCLVLVPSGETDLTREGRLEGDVHVPLTGRGRRRTERVGRRVREEVGRVDAVYSSANQGAFETAEILAGPDGCRVRVLRRLEGVSLGLWEGQRRAEVRQRHARIYERWTRDPLAITPPAGERMASAYARVGAALRTIRKRHRRGVVAVVAPETVIALLRCHLEDLPAARVFQVARRLSAFEMVAPAPVTTHGGR